MKSHSNHQIYENCRVEAPDGTEIFRCSKKRIDWYLSRRLADIVPDKSPLTIRLKFKPKGLGWAGDPFYLQERENHCCVCKSTEELSKHHVVPLAYRRHFPEKLKKSNYYDILVLCFDCHMGYESKALDKRKEFETRYNAPLGGTNNLIVEKYPKYASTLLTCGDKIPAERKKYMMEFITTHIGRVPSEKDLNDLARLSRLRREKDLNIFKSHYEIVVGSITNIDEFVQEWRTHFVDTMKPQFLPKYWEIKRDVFGKKTGIYQV